MTQPEEPGPAHVRVYMEVDDSGPLLVGDAWGGNEVPKLLLSIARSWAEGYDRALARQQAGQDGQDGT